jgi:hypothetical protein
MRIDDGDHLPANGGNLINHFFGGGKGLLVPSEIALTICVLNIKPDYIIRDIVLLKLLINSTDIILILVVPATLRV